MQLSPPEIPGSVVLQKHLTLTHIDMWLKDDVFHNRWWILLGLICVSLIIWFILLDKSRAKDICLYAALSTVFVLGMVEYGEELILWDYPTDIIPIFPPLTSFNLLLLPLAYSLLYQSFRTWKGFIGSTIVVSAIISFVIEPLLSWGDLYQLINWKYYFSYPVYIALALVTKVLTIKINEITQRNRPVIQ
jgi:hypothetical protein